MFGQLFSFHTFFYLSKVMSYNPQIDNKQNHNLINISLKNTTIQNIVHITVVHVNFSYSINKYCT